MSISVFVFTDCANPIDGDGIAQNTCRLLAHECISFLRNCCEPKFVYRGHRKNASSNHAENCISEAKPVCGKDFPAGTTVVLHSATGTSGRLEMRRLASASSSLYLLEVIFPV
jgi:hypothetical protein